MPHFFLAVSYLCVRALSDFLPISSPFSQVSGMWLGQPVNCTPVGALSLFLSPRVVFPYSVSDSLSLSRLCCHCPLLSGVCCPVFQSRIRPLHTAVRLKTLSGSFWLFPPCCHRRSLLVSAFLSFFLCSCLFPPFVSRLIHLFVRSGVDVFKIFQPPDLLTNRHGCFGHRSGD